MKTSTLILAVIVAVAGTAALAASGTNAANVADTLTNQMKSFAKLITAASYVAGMAFAVGAVVKFKAHKDNPTQIPIGTPIALLFVGAALIFIPSVFGTMGGTLWGSGGEKGGASGTATFTGGTKAGT